MRQPPATHDVVIVGGGHNALVAAAYLARAGQKVVVLERLAHLGGAAVSESPWPGVDARLSRYSYLVSLLPRTIIDDLGLRIDLRRRRYSSYTPDPSDPSRGILVDTGDAAATGGLVPAHDRRPARGGPVRRDSRAHRAGRASALPRRSPSRCRPVPPCARARRRRAVGRADRAPARRTCCAIRSRPTSRAASP